MKCPLLSTTMGVNDGVPIPIVYNCLQAECAWWSSEARACAIETLSARLGTICDSLTNIANLMSRGGVR